MIDIDPRLDTKLRSKYDRIEAENLPATLVHFDPAVDRTRRSVLNPIVGAAGIAVVAAALATFGLQLSGHLHLTTAPTANGAQHTLARLPVVGDSGLPVSAHIVVPVTHGRGPAVLPAFISTSEVYVQYDCVGGGQFEIESTVRTATPELLPCSSATGPVTAAIAGTGTGTPTTLKIVARASMRWELLIAESDVPASFPSLSPFLPESVFPLLVGDTYAEGSGSLPSFTPTMEYSIQYACLGTGSIDILASDGSVHHTSGSCSSPGINGLLVPQDQITGKPVSLRVETTVSTTWELRVVQYGGAAPQSYESAPPSPHPGYPVDFTLHPGETSLIPDTHGMGSTTLPTFTPTTRFYDSVLTCSGPGSLEIIGSDGSTFTQESCEVSEIGSGAGGDAQAGVPISLTIKADPGTTWEIIVYGVNVMLPQP